MSARMFSRNFRRDALRLRDAVALGRALGSGDGQLDRCPHRIVGLGGDAHWRIVPDAPEARGAGRSSGGVRIAGRVVAIGFLVGRLAGRVVACGVLVGPRRPCRPRCPQACSPGSRRCPAPACGDPRCGRGRGRRLGPWRGATQAGAGPGAGVGRASSARRPGMRVTLTTIVVLDAPDRFASNATHATRSYKSPSARPASPAKFSSGDGITPKTTIAAPAKTATTRHFPVRPLLDRVGARQPRRAVSRIDRRTPPPPAASTSPPRPSSSTPARSSSQSR